MAIDATTSTKPRYTKAALKAMIGKRGRKPAEFYVAYPNERPEVKAELKAAAAQKAKTAKAKAKAKAARAKTKTVG